MRKPDSLGIGSVSNQCDVRLSTLPWTQWLSTRKEAHNKYKYVDYVRCNAVFLSAQVNTNHSSTCSRNIHSNTFIHHHTHHGSSSKQRLQCSTIWFVHSIRALVISCLADQNQKCHSFSKQYQHSGLRYCPMLRAWETTTTHAIQRPQGADRTPNARRGNSWLFNQRHRWQTVRSPCCYACWPYTRPGLATEHSSSPINERVCHEISKATQCQLSGTLGATSFAAWTLGRCKTRGRTLLWKESFGPWRLQARETPSGWSKGILKIGGRARAGWTRIWV